MSVTIPILTFFSGSDVAAGSAPPPALSSSSPHAATTVPMHSARTAMSSNRMKLRIHGIHPPFQMICAPLQRCASLMQHTAGHC